MSSQHEFVVCFNSETNIWSIDYEGSERFSDGTVWVPDVTRSSEGEWIQLDWESDDPAMKALTKIDDFATGLLAGTLLSLNNKANGSA